MAKPQTITQKILAAHCGKDYVEPGELIMARVDIALGNDITAPLAIKDFHKVGAKKVFDRSRVVLVCDHFAPNKDIPSAIQCQQLRNFAREQDLTHFYDGGDMGVEHALLPEQGIVGPGDVIIGADSHTCTYGALGAFATGVGSTDLAAVMATGECWFKVPESIRLVYRGTAAGLDYRQGPDPPHHRRYRGGRGPVSGHGVHRRGHRRAAHGGPVFHGQHGRGSRGQERHHGPG